MVRRCETEPNLQLETVARARRHEGGHDITTMAQSHRSDIYGDVMKSDEILLENGIVIRSARAGDEAEIANVHLNSWRESYRGLTAGIFGSVALDFQPEKKLVG